jgi:hypothetical protein
MGFTDHAERYSQRRAVVVGGATVDFARTPTIMIIIGIVLVLVGLAYLCWLLFTLAIMRLHGSLTSPLRLHTDHSIRGRSERSSSG